MVVVGASSPTMLLNGVLLLDKPRGMSSTAVVRALKHRLPQRIALGHAGTLDPLAQGVLPILCGTATRLQELLHEFPKRYTVTAEFGCETDSLDRDGEVVATTPQVPTAAMVQAGCRTLTGDVWQIPPLYSAVKLRGKPLYRYARQAEVLPVALPQLRRRVKIFNFAMLQMQARQATFTVTCSKGTYVRSLIRDLAHRLGSLAVVTELVREESAGLHRGDCQPLAAINRENFAKLLLPFTRLALPQLRVGDRAACRRLRYGQRLPCPANLFSSPRLKFLLADARGEVFGIGKLRQEMAGAVLCMDRML